jgi:hypothetical protein
MSKVVLGMGEFVSMKGLKDIALITSGLGQMPVFWDGKDSVLELKAAHYNWKQMEWWAFYFEHKFRALFDHHLTFPGERYDQVQFDLKGEINWDLKAKAITSGDQKVILNDKTSMENSIARHGYHGEIIGLCDVEYDDDARSFQHWHTQLKGGLSAYEKERKTRTSTSRWRKKSATLKEVAFVVFEEKDLPKLLTMKQGRNSNGKPRPEKYMLDMTEVNLFFHERFLCR